MAIFGGDLKRNVTFQDLQSMRYLEMVVKEGLRMYPSVPIFSRKFCEDIEIGGGMQDLNVSQTV